MPPPLVSIIINNYNYGRYLAASIDSSLAQDYPLKEVIVVDDGSTDDSREIISRYNGQVVAVLKQNGGQASAFNACFEKSKGQIVCFLDSDDVFLPTKVSDVVNALRDETLGWCFHDNQWTDALLQPVANSAHVSVASGRYDFREEAVAGTCQFRPPATSGLAFSRPLLQTLLPMPQDIRITSDNYIKFASIALSPGYFLATPLALQRIHGENAYTAKEDDNLRANITIATANCLRHNFPTLRKSCNRLFAIGVEYKWKAGATFANTVKTISDYFVDLPLLERCETLARILVKVTRRAVHSSNL
jgi:glycosyltransferase involved in cell wall biosynthesis